MTRWFKRKGAALIKWLKDNGATLVFIVVIAAIGGLAGATAPIVWFFRGVCW